MPGVLPFAALRYAPDLAPDLTRVICPPYDVISIEEQAHLLAESPYNAVALELPPERGGNKYAEAAETLREWCAQGVLHQDPRPAYYLTETQFTHAGQTSTRRDLIAAVDVEPWSG